MFGHQNDWRKSHRQPRLPNTERGRRERGDTHLGPEAEGRQDRRGGHVDVHAVLLLVQLQVPELVHGERLERGVEERDGVQPLEERRHRLAVDEQPGEQEAGARAGSV